MYIADWSVACFTTYNKYGGRVSRQRGQDHSDPGSRPHPRVLLHLRMCCDSYSLFFFFFCVTRAPTVRHVFDLVYLCLVSDHDAMEIL